MQENEINKDKKKKKNEKYQISLNTWIPICVKICLPSNVVMKYTIARRTIANFISNLTTDCSLWIQQNTALI